MENMTPITREEMLMNDEPLTPITREEKILAGEDIECVTRREYFLKKYRHAGGDVMVEGLEVTANGTYTAPEGKAYSPVEVAVPLPENAYLLKEASGSLVSFSDGTDLPMPSFICKIEAVQSGSGEPSPENVRPISGHTGVDANVKGKNFIDWSNWTVGETTIEKTFPIDFNISQYYTLSGLGNTYRSCLYAYDAENNLVGRTTERTREYATFQKTSFTAGGGGTQDFDSIKYIRLLFSLLNAEAIEVIKNYQIQAEIGETATTYEPYNPKSQTIQVSWQTEAGEVYGGYIDLVSGVLTVDRKYKLFDGTEAWTITTSSSGTNYITIDDMKVGERLDGICNYFDTAISGSAAENEGKCQFGSNNQRFYILNAKGVYDADTQAKMRALTTGMQIVYPLATPITYQLTPTQIKSLLGNNNAWCSTGDVDIQYFAKEVTG